MITNNYLKVRHEIICSKIKKAMELFGVAVQPDEKLKIDERISAKFVELERLEQRICATAGDPVFKLKIALANATIAGEENSLAWMMVQSALLDLENAVASATQPWPRPAADQAKQAEYQAAA